VPVSNWFSPNVSPQSSQSAQRQTTREDSGSGYGREVFTIPGGAPTRSPEIQTCSLCVLGVLCGPTALFGFGVILTLLLSSVPLPASPQLSLPQVPAGCQVERVLTVPAPVDMAEVLQDVYALEDTHHIKLFSESNPKLERALAALFDLTIPKSKLDQFYSLLFYLDRYASHPGTRITFEISAARRLLLSSKVFSDPAFPGQMTQIELTRTDRSQPRYQVLFERPEVRLPLNHGWGFGVRREGMCQHAKELVFYGGFAFSLRMNGESLDVFDFDGVDLYGNFGARGLVDIDISYVSIKSVEFRKGTPLGLVRAKVSQREFEANQHSFWLRVITRFVTDKSLQAIDW
jgi:hypothetical protein